MSIKKIAVFLLIAVLTLASCHALAEQTVTVKQGEQFWAEFVLTENPENAVAAVIRLEYDHGVFELIPSDNIRNDHPLFSVMLDGIAVGTPVGAEFRVAKTAVDGKYVFYVVTEQAGDFNETEVTGLAFSACTVIVTVRDEVREWLDQGEKLYAEGKFEEAVKYFSKAAEQGSTDGMNYLGRCYEDGYGIEKNLEKAISYYRQAADHLNVNALNNLGRCYSKGIGVSQDYAEAAKYFQASADMGDSNGQFELANLYFIGKGVPKDYSQNAKYLRLAAEQGHSAAQYNLGYCYENGQGVPKDLQEAKKYYQLAAAQGHEGAIERLKTWTD